MTTPPTISGCSGRSIDFAQNPLWSSQIATTTAAATMNMNAVFQNSSETAIATSSTTAEMIAAGRSRPARPWSRAGGGDAVPAGGPGDGASVMVSGCSDLEQLGLLVLQ